MKRLLVILALCAVAVAPVLASDRESKKHDDDSGTSHESAYYTFMESTSDGEVTLMVASHIAYWHTEDDYFPVQIAMGAFHEKEKGSYKVMLNSFTLLTPDGKAYKPTTYADIMDEYKKRQEDQNLIESDPMNTTDIFATCTELNAPFYPETASPRMVTGGTELPSSTYFRDLLYFPMPEGGLDGVLTVLVETPKIDPPLAVKFRIPEKHEKGKSKHHDETAKKENDR